MRDTNTRSSSYIQMADDYVEGIVTCRVQCHVSLEHAIDVSTGLEAIWNPSIFLLLPCDRLGYSRLVISVSSEVTTHTVLADRGRALHH